MVNVDTRALPAPVITGPLADSLHLANPSIVGTGLPGYLLHLRLDGVALPPTRVAQNGTWSIVLPAAPVLRNGSHVLVATQVSVAPPSDGTLGESPESNRVEFFIGFAQGAGFVCSAPTSSAPSLGALWWAALALALTLAWRRRRGHKSP